MTNEQLNQQMDETFYYVEKRFRKVLNKKNKKNKLNARSIFMEWGEVFTHEDYDDPVEILWVPNFDQFTTS